MKPVFQTRYGVGGNCFQAAVASLFEKQLDEIPDFCNIYTETGSQWFEEFVLWLNQFHKSGIIIETNSECLKRFYFRGCYLLVGGKNQGGLNHEVIYKNGKLAHDPSPNTKEFIPEDIILIFNIFS